MRPYSTDLRQRIVDAYERREGSMRDLAERFDVNHKSVFGLVHLARETGSVAPKPHAGGLPSKLDGEGFARLHALVMARPDATLAELRDEVARELHVTYSTSRLCRLLAKLGLSRKKRPCTPTSDGGRTS